MHALVIDQIDPLSAEVVDRDVALPSAGMLRVEVRAAVLARAELAALRVGRRAAGPSVATPLIPGVVVAGVVADPASDTGFRRGDRVVACPGAGAAAALVDVAPGRARPIPDGLTFGDAAEHFAAHLLGHRAVRPDQLEAGALLVVRGEGDVAAAAISVGRDHGLRTLAVVDGGAPATTSVRDADEVIDRDDGWLDRVRALGGAAVVLEALGGEDLVDGLRALAIGGRMAIVGLTGPTPGIKVNRLLLRNLVVEAIDLPGVIRSRPGLVEAAASAWAGPEDGWRPTAPRSPLDGGQAVLRPLREDGADLVVVELDGVALDGVESGEVGA